ncbi:CPBP family intramembrane metalloprotease [Xenorhabdus sp. Reich]|uniref:CPBP family intramembrane metalloprotease n=1 Tax=Xenorhabdus littoralis TaxID=2582835 RepID=A0ABU4SP66_9GAMM|nr:CPBP family intramembrane glutamic endopeptidase [Xenorhabdus sp. Reich]MDX8000432.1 CPBP family intramembrane metalloprotease [Xenorhabdus sp. Reich]
MSLDFNKLSMSAFCFFIYFIWMFLSYLGVGLVQITMESAFILKNIEFISFLINFLVVTPCIIIIYFHYNKKHNDIPLGNINKDNLVLFTTFSFVFIIISMIFGNEETYYLQLIDNSSNSSILFLGFYVVVLAPITEEIVMRGFVLNSFLMWGKHLQLTGVIITSFLFTILHTQYQYINTYIFLFIFSVILCYARIHSGGLKLPILLHVLANLSSMMFLLSY